MLKQIIYSLGFAIIAGITIQGCATTSLTPDMEPTWRSQVPIDALGTGYVSKNEDHIIIGNDKDIYILDAENGSVIESMEEGFWESIRPEVNVAGVTFDDTIGDAYNLVPLENTNIVLLFDYRYDEETVTAFDIETGETIWQNNYEYSIQKYSDIIEAAAEKAAGAVANMLGGEAETQSNFEKREQANNFIKSIVYQVSESTDFLLKTFDGLVMLDGTDGSEKWAISDFKGSGIAGAEILPNGDLVVLGGGRDLYNLELAEAYHVAKVSGDGELQWMSEHSGSRISDLYTTEEHVIVDGAPTEVFSMSDGEKLWENDIYKGDRHHAMLVTDNNLYMAGDLESKDVQFGVAGWIWEHDLDTGEVIWKTDETSTTFHEIYLVDDIILAKGNGKLFDGNGGIAAIDANTGEELWTTPKMSRPGGFLGGQQKGVYYGEHITDPLVYEDKVYAAGPDNIYGVDLNSGDIIFEDNHDDRGTGGTNERLARYEDQVLVVGVETTVAYNAGDGSVEFATETENTSSFIKCDQQLVLRDDRERVGSLNLETGVLGPMMRTERTGSGRFGDFSDPFYIGDDGSYVITLGFDGHLAQFPL